MQTLGDSRKCYSELLECESEAFTFLEYSIFSEKDFDRNRQYGIKIREKMSDGTVIKEKFISNISNKLDICKNLTNFLYDNLVAAEHFEDVLSDNLDSFM